VLPAITVYLLAPLLAAWVSVLFNPLIPSCVGN
jgi:hypothetical protein